MNYSFNLLSYAPKRFLLVSFRTHFQPNTSDSHQITSLRYLRMTHTSHLRINYPTQTCSCPKSTVILLSIHHANEHAFCSIHAAAAAAESSRNDFLSLQLISGHNKQSVNRQIQSRRCAGAARLHDLALFHRNRSRTPRPLS